ncbi:hypothetical protein D4100_04275 [Serratia inhibens]|uniref:Uncharacterized protein n=1 Tax=Serratia inhibens TaxID=2338073 RepID=A0AA92XA66_9GAMM|nr:hypothetical protein D4100_04275 [Serratia inhibens]
MGENDTGHHIRQLLHGLQNGNDLVLSESGFSHGDLFKRHIQYVGISLKVNGSFCRDAYTGTIRSTAFIM